MATQFGSLKEVLDHGFDDVIDVRSPAEFAIDHIPGAISLPVLSDRERAEVGTIYKQQSPFRARKIGAALVARNAAAHLQGPLADREGGWRPLVYCWRGGQRSGSFATILSQVGWRADVVDGGYRSYRRLVTGYLYDTPLPHRLVLLDGNTGTAKTELLGRLRAQGVQTVDLEALAHHRGSVLGSGDAPQPSQKMFETSLAAALCKLDPERPVVIEAESSRIGELSLPPSLWQAMGDAPRITLSAPLDERARYLATAYADLASRPDLLKERLAVLIPLRGRAVVEHWGHLVDAGRHEDLARELITAHYDPAYVRSRESRAVARQIPVALETLDEKGLTTAVGQIYQALLDLG